TVPYRELVKEGVLSHLFHRPDPASFLRARASADPTARASLERYWSVSYPGLIRPPASTRKFRSWRGGRRQNAGPRPRGRRPTGSSDRKSCSKRGGRGLSLAEGPIDGTTRWSSRPPHNHRARQGRGR